MEEWFECTQCHKRFSSEAHEEFVEAEKCPCGGHLEPACPRCHRCKCVCGEPEGLVSEAPYGEGFV